MTDTRFEERLRDALRHEAERVPLPRPEWQGEIALENEALSRGHRRRVVIGAIAALIPLVVAVAFVATRHRDGGSQPRDVVVTNESTTTSSPAPAPQATASTDLWIPTAPGVSITSFSRDEFSPDPSELAVWLRCRPCDAPTAAYGIERRDDGSAVGGLAGAATFEPLTVHLDDSVTEARIARDIAYMGGVTVLDVRRGENGFVITGWGSEDDFIALARMELRLATAPDSLELAYEGQVRMDSGLPPRAAGTVITSVTFSTDTLTDVSVSATDHDDVPLLAALPFFPNAMRVEIDGVPGFALASGAYTVLAWKPDPQTTLVLQAKAELSAVIAVAGDVDRVPLSTWEPLAAEALATLPVFDPSQQPVLADGSPDCRPLIKEGEEMLASGVLHAGHLLCASLDRRGGTWMVRVFVDGQGVYAFSTTSACPRFDSWGVGPMPLTNGGLTEPRGLAVDDYLIVGTVPPGTTSVSVTSSDGTTRTAAVVPPTIDGSWGFFAMFVPDFDHQIELDPAPPDQLGPPPTC